MKRRLRDKRPILDTNVFVEFDVPPPVLSKMMLSSVVLYELIAANIDDSTLDLYESWKRAYSNSRQLLTPNLSDWFECSKLIRNLVRGSRSRTRGTIQKIASAQQQQNDALIARTAIMHNCFVVTSNLKDFERFTPYMKELAIVPAIQFFA